MFFGLVNLCIIDVLPISSLIRSYFRYGMAVSWLTALVMTVVHDRVPDMAKYVKVQEATKYIGMITDTHRCLT